ncbi:aminotransferase class I/II-fold pyridoxal phosphate-dependent enzyme [Pseudomonas sp.]|uniref:aminotransferase class I/II-fold pyridoxal phosphate-dependent enzyme n=1 Tax=Pseudomonas sp. TaxID=306 RepID=UPI003A96D48F
MNDKSKSQIDSLLAKVRSGIARNASEPVVNQDLQAPDASKYPEYSLVKSIKSLYNDDSAISNPYFLARSGEVSSNLQIAGNDYITFSNYNYLGLSHDPRVKAAVHQAVDQYGCHAGAARMVGGEIELHAQLEQELAEFTGFEAVSVGVGGYSANVSVIGYLLDKQDLIIHDEYMHNSAIMGSVMSGARRIAFAHNDMAALDRLLSENRPHYRRALILVEGAYSMDGDLVDLPGVVALKKKHGAWLMIDEAHSVGTVGKTGRGVCEHFAVNTAEVDLIIGTLSKSFASCGGFVAGKKQLIELLHHFCPGLLLYSTGISPANTAAALAAVRLASAEPERVERLQHNAERFKQMAEERGLDCRSSLAGVPIIPLMIKDERALQLMSKLLDNSIIAHAVMHPVVPREAARLRCFISHDHDETMFARTLDLLVKDASSAL